MSFNGSGTFQINTTGQPVVTGTVISSSAFNLFTADIGTGLSTCITKDGQTAITANIPWGSFKITGLGNPTIAGDALNFNGPLGTPSSGVATNLTGIPTSGITGTLGADHGGTGQSSYAIGDLLYASGATALSKLADVATGNALISGGVTTAPAWGKVTLTGHISGILPVANGGTATASYTIGDLLQASASGVLATLASVATGNVLISGGVGVVSAWGKVGLTTHVTGTLAAGNGGTGITSLGTGVATALGTNIGSAGAFITFNGALGTPSSGSLANCTAYPGTSALVTTGALASGSIAAGFGAIAPTGAISTAATTESTTTTTGALKSAGGLGVVKNANIGGDMTVTGASALNGSAVAVSNVSGAYAMAVANQASSGDNVLTLWYTDGFVARGSVSYNRAGGLVAYNVTSDYRAKKLYGDFSSSGAMIDAIPVHYGHMRGSWLMKPLLVAHEVQAVVPSAVIGGKDAVDENGDPIMQQLAPAELIPLMLAEIKSLRVRVANLGG